MINDREAVLRTRLKDDFEFYAKKCLHVRDKAGKISALALNKSQLFLHNKLEEQLERTGMIRALVLKGRQQGVSTYTEGRFYWKVTHRRGVRAFILTHEDAATQNLFEMASRYHSNCPHIVRPETGTSNAKELTFGKLDSGYKLGTAGTKAVGRSSTTQYFHGCLAEGTLVLDPSTDRLVPIEQYEVGQLVRTHTGAVAPVSFISTQEKECHEMVLRGYGKFPLVSSAEHKFWTLEGWKEQKDLKIGDVLGFPIDKIVGHQVLLPFRQPDEVRAQGGGSSESVSEIIVLNYDIGRLMGLYLAEGCIIKQTSGKYSGVSFSVHDREVPRTLEWLKSSFNLYSSVKVCDTKGSNGSLISVHGKSFGAFFDKMCGSVDTKHAPRDWRTYGEDFCRGLLHGYLSGDGSCSVEQRRIVAPSTREAITLGMRDITASLGYGWASIGYQNARTSSGRNEQAQFHYALCGLGADKLAAELGVVVKSRTQEHTRGNYIQGEHAWVYINSIQPVGIKTVYDFEVDHDDHSYCTVLSGVHNSEIAFWPHAESHFAGIMQSIPHADGTEVILESTANGAGGKFYEMWQDAEKGKGEFIAIFMPWFWQSEYSVDPKEFIFTDKEKALAKLHKLTDSQLAWRQLKVHELGESLFHQEYPCTAQEAFLVSGRPVFDPKLLMEAELECFSPSYRAEVIDGGRITRHEEGALRVWDDPVPGKRYAIGADVAEGLAHGDYSCAQVLTVPDGVQVAEWHGHVDPDRFGDVLVSLGKRYNRAFVGVERNNHGLTTLTNMLHAGYANMYVQHDIEHRSGQKQMKKMGWLTTRKSKPKIIDQLASELRDGDHGIADKNLIDEMKRYQIGENGSYNAQDGYHDDRVMARAIAGEMVTHAPRNRLTETW